MRLEIQTDPKVIKILDKVNLEDFIKAIKKMFPDDYKEYSIETGTQVIWNQYPVYKYYDYNWYHRSIPSISYTAGSQTGTTSLSTASTTGTIGYNQVQKPKENKYLVEI